MSQGTWWSSVGVSRFLLTYTHLKPAHDPPSLATRNPSPPPGAPALLFSCNSNAQVWKNLILANWSFERLLQLLNLRHISEWHHATCLHALCENSTQRLATTIEKQQRSNQLRTTKTRCCNYTMCDNCAFTFAGLGNRGCDRKVLRNSSENNQYSLYTTTFYWV